MVFPKSGRRHFTHKLHLVLQDNGAAGKQQRPSVVLIAGGVQEGLGVHLVPFRGTKKALKVAVFPHNFLGSCQEDFIYIYNFFFLLRENYAFQLDNKYRALCLKKVFCPTLVKTNKHTTNKIMKLIFIYNVLESLFYRYRN